MSGALEWALFLGLSGISVVMAAGMLLTMSMYRAGLALMSSFVALAGLFLLLDADLLAAIQVMMNVGGMLVMILFMVMLMMDPGGEMMWDMKRKMRLPGPGAFSMSMPRGAPPAPEAERAPTQAATDWTCPMHPQVSQPGPGQCPICGMDLIPRSEQGDGPDTSPSAAGYTCPMHPEVRQPGPGQCPKCGMDLMPEEAPATAGYGGHADHRLPAGHADKHAGRAMDAHGAYQGNGGMGGGMSLRQHYQMMADMAMSTAQLPWALMIGAATAAVLVMLVARTPWPLASGGPTQDATSAVGELLLSRYMIGFEGAAFLILAGIVGAVVFGIREPGASRAAAGPTAASAAGYTCPMHPEVRQPGPGQCPKCGMDLVPAAEAQPSGGAQAGEQAKSYTCPMHPEVRQDHPGQCPKCGMDLVPMPEAAPATTDAHGGHG